MRIQEFLNEKGVSFEPIPHRPTFTAQYTAQTESQVVVAFVAM